MVSLLIAGVGVCLTDAPGWTTAAVAGFILAMFGTLGTFASQSSMGSSWRIGVDPTERTTLRTQGLFALVRNPIFTAMTLTLVGFALVSQHSLVVAGFVMFVLAIELQVRGVEEPYLSATHGPEFQHYASAVGRFIPGIGCRNHPPQ